MVDSFSRSFGKLSHDDPKGALEYADKLPAAMRIMALSGIAADEAVYTNDTVPHTDIRMAAADQLPPSELSMDCISQITRGLALQNADLDTAVEERTDPYGRRAAMTGVVEGKASNRGVNGLSEAVRRGMASGEEGWFEAAAGVILQPMLSRYYYEEPRPSPNWKTIPPDIADVLTRYAQVHSPPEKAAALQAKLH